MTGLFFATGIRERYFFVIAPAIILAYNIYVGSIGGIINESLVIIINLITIIRMIRARDRQISLK